MRIQLETGQLDFHVTRSTYSPEQLTGFASRNNPQRGFLFVSKVLGKHWPVRPSVMRRIHVELATMLAERVVEGPVFVVGMAETATALGRGVFEEFCAATGIEGLYCHTTRYRIQNNAVLNFSEEHCHASEQLLHLPRNPAEQSLLHRAKTLVLIDDEMSTGKTFQNLISVLQEKTPHLSRVIIVTLLDMTGQAGIRRLQAHIPCPVQQISLLEGTFTFHPRHDMCWKEPAKSVGNGLSKDHLLPQTGGRTGILPAQWNAQSLPCGPLRDGTVLVLGTGEFMYEPYRLALALEEDGREVYFQATTRSPILLGNDISSILDSVDNYGEGIDNFLYNVKHEHYDNILLCYETTHLPPEHSLPRRLGASCCHLLR